MVEVSVVMPTHNYGQYISRAIDSVLSQQGVNVELIVVDDGSTDDTTEVLASYGERLRPFRQKNQGAPTARNLGLQKATGEFVVFLDSDDWLLEDALRSRLEFLRENGECAWVYGPCIYHDEQGNDVTGQFQDSSFAYRAAREGNIISHLLMGERIHICCVMLKTELARKVGGFRTDLPVLQDYEFWLRVAAEATAGFIADCNVVVMTHIGSISRSSGDNYRTLLSILQDAETRYPEAVGLLGRTWQKQMAAILLERAAHLLKDGEKTSARDLLQQAVRRNPLQLKSYLYYLRSFI